MWRPPSNGEASSHMIRIGDRLRASGCGPILFAEEHGASDHMKCSWMDPMGQWHTGVFASGDLVKIDEPALVQQRPGWSHMLTRVSSFVGLW